MTLIAFLRNPDIFATHCDVSQNAIAVGILAIRTNAVFGTKQILYDNDDNPFPVIIPLEPEPYGETFERIPVIPTV